MSKALPSGEIKLASLQLLGTSAELFFSAFAVLDIDARSESFYDSALFVAHWHFAMKEQAVLSICASHARFRFEGFSAGQCGMPCLNYSGHVVRVNKVGPTPTADRI